MASGITRLLSLLELERIEVNIFRGESLRAPWMRVYGGQVAAQALIAAGRTVERGHVHSLHAYFLLPGDPQMPILYEVDRIRDGRSFTTRRVVAIQNGRPIFHLSCSFHVDEQGLEHQQQMADVPSPQALLENHAEQATRFDSRMATLLKDQGVEICFVPNPSLERLQVWLKVMGTLPDEPLLHCAFVTFLSDLTLIDTVLHRHGRSFSDDSMYLASLDHCMWFHRSLRADQWLFYDQTSPSSSGARGLTLGELYDESGRLVATVAQEGLIREGQST